MTPGNLVLSFRVTLTFNLTARSRYLWKSPWFLAGKLMSGPQAICEHKCIYCHNGGNFW